MGVALPALYQKILKGKYRNESTRLQYWDLRQRWRLLYYHREHYFGEIKNGKMLLTSAYAITHVLWNEIKNHAKNIVLGEFIVMPNHIHGVLMLHGNNPQYHL